MGGIGDKTTIVCASDADAIDRRSICLATVTFSVRYFFCAALFFRRILSFNKQTNRVE